MSVYTESGLKHVRSIEHDIRNARRDDFESERGHQFDAWKNRRHQKVAEQLGKEVIEGRFAEPEPVETDEAAAWELHRIAEERNQSTQD